jgi:hypothetical protein
METKVCSKCETEKEICEFGNLKSSKDGYNKICKNCRKIITDRYKHNNIDKVKLSKQLYSSKNYEKEKNRKKEWKKNNLEYFKEYRVKNKINEIERHKNWVENNKEKVKVYKKKYLDENREEIKNKRNQYNKIRNENDFIFNLRNRMRNRLYHFLTKNNIVKTNKTFDIVGCSPEFLKKHLETQFTDGMNWDNRSEWHIDHKIPLSSAKTEEELYKLCHYTNLQPLWVKENLKKSNKIIV